MSTPQYRSFRFSSSGPQPTCQQASRGFLFAAFALLVVSGFLLCFCWQIYLAVAVCSVLAFCFGAWQQRLVAVALFAVAVVVGVLGYQQERAFRLRLKALPAPTATPNQSLQPTAGASGSHSKFHG